MSTPHQGDPVIFRYGENAGLINGHREHPAIITRVLTDVCVNLRVFTDGAGIPWMIAVLHRDHAGAGDDSWRRPDDEAARDE